MEDRWFRLGDHSVLLIMLHVATNSLVANARSSTSTDAELNAVAQSFFDAISTVSRDEANAALRTLSQHFNLANPSRSGFLALICGTLIERGCDPLAIAAPLTERLAILLKSSVELANTCAEQSTDSEGDDPIENFEQKRARNAATMEEQNAAWEALHQFWRPAIVVYSLDAQARSSARHLRTLAAQISEFHDAGHWLALMLAVLDDEPLVAIEPQTRLGIVGRISGIVDNFQLNVLLMDGFPNPGLLRRRRVTQEVAAIANGKGPQQSGHTVTGVWNLYTWKAIGPGLTLPDANDYGANDHWVWNEGCPDDIPVFDGHRAVLLGPASYPRSWQSQRMFNHLAANIEIERKLTKDEVSDWLKRMAAAKEAS